MEDAAQRWSRDGADWPHRERSRFVEAGGLRWHVQQWPAPATAPGHSVLLLHGTGAATHSWRTLAPLLARWTGVIAVDLPGHGFTEALAPGHLADPPHLPGMAAAVAALLAAIGAQPALLVGHSAGAAIALQLVLDTPLRPQAVAGLNAALLPMGGPLWPLLAGSARAMAGSGWLMRQLARQAAQPALLRHLIDGTGSRLDARGVELYGRLVRMPSHVAGALAMMAHWDLRPLLARLPALQTPLQLIVGEADRTVPPWQARHVWKLLPPAQRLDLVALPGRGHLAHEEAAGEVDEILQKISHENARQQAEV